MKNIEKVLSKKYGNSILYSVTMIRPTFVTGKGRRTRNYTSSLAYEQRNEMLESGLFHYESGNDAPRGGACGEWHRFTPKVRRLGLKKQDAEKELARIEQRRIEELKVAAQLEMKEKEKDAEFEAILPFVNEDEIYASKELTGIEKSNKQASILKGLLEKACIEKSVDFWGLWRRLSGLCKSKAA